MLQQTTYMAHLVDRALLTAEQRVGNPRQAMQAARLLMHGLARGGIDTRVMEHLQAIRLRRIVAYAAAHSPFYREQFARLGIGPDDIRSGHDVRQLPFTTSADIRDWQRFLCVPPEALSAVFTTSGSTGEPKRVYYTFADLQALTNFAAISLRVAQGLGRLTVLIALPVRHGLWMGSAQAVRTVERAGGLPLPVGMGQPAETLAWMRRFEPDTIMSSPSYMVALTEEAKRQNYRPPVTRLTLGGELLTAAARAALADYWRAEVIDAYGSTEIGAAQAMTLPGSEGLVVNEFHLFTEIVDPSTGQPADEGELVFTTFPRQAMPFLRYRSGDRARWLDCHARLPWRCIQILGRLDDLLVVGDMNLYGERIASRLAELSGGHVELVVDKVGLTDRLRVRVEAGDRAAVKDALCGLYPEMGDALRVGNLRLEVETGADLAGQLKGLRIRDVRTPP